MVGSIRSGHTCHFTEFHREGTIIEGLSEKRASVPFSLHWTEALLPPSPSIVVFMDYASVFGTLGPVYAGESIAKSEGNLLQENCNLNWLIQ